jgi:HlyD family type I secretion membrane fusion protein
MTKRSTLKDHRPRFGLGLHVFAGALAGILLVGGVGGWAATAELEGAVIAQGTVQVREKLKEIQHPYGGVVAEILVERGARVAEGDVLVRLEDVQTRAELSIIEAQLAEQVGRRARLEAERDGSARIAFPPDLARLGDEAPQIMIGERRLFDGDRENREGRKAQLELGIEQTGEEVRGLRARIEAMDDEIAVVAEELEKLEGLLAQGHVPAARVQTAKVDAIRLRGERGEIEAAIARANVRIGEMRLQILAIDQTARTEAQRELRTVEAKIVELQDRRAAVRDRLARSEIRAPIDGVVNELGVHTIGGVISPAETIATLVPENATHVVAVQLRPMDIDQVSPGLTARMRFSSFDRNTTPEVDGVVVHVAPAAIRDPASGALHYEGEIALTEALPMLEGRTLLPGMPVEVFVTTGGRTALSYLTKPLVDQFAKAFRES